MNKPNPDGRRYRAAMIELALSYAPRMYPCGSCGWPVADGYCCSTCGSDNPREARPIKRKYMTQDKNDAHVIPCQHCGKMVKYRGMTNHVNRMHPAAAAIRAGRAGE
jgi:DNA-directed RNA polymerase subunit RPC12/RpoP